jgi:hypothetical protein
MLSPPPPQMLNTYPYQQGYHPQQGYSYQQGYPSQQMYTKDDINKFNEMQSILQTQGSFSQSKYSKQEIENFYKMQQMQMQQMQQYPVLTPQQREDMMRYYNIINTQLQNILYTENKNNIDPYHLISAALDTKDLSKEQMNLFFKHLLFYTYRASASEISNHLEVNKHLEEIKQVLLKLAPPTPTP